VFTGIVEVVPSHEYTRDTDFEQVMGPVPEEYTPLQSGLHRRWSIGSSRAGLLSGGALRRFEFAIGQESLPPVGGSIALVIDANVSWSLLGRINVCWIAKSFFWQEAMYVESQ